MGSNRCLFSFFERNMYMCGNGNCNSGSYQDTCAPENSPQKSCSNEHQCCNTTPTLPPPQQTCGDGHEQYGGCGQGKHPCGGLMEIGRYHLTYRNPASGRLRDRHLWVPVSTIRHADRGLQGHLNLESLLVTNALNLMPGTVTRSSYELVRTAMWGSHMARLDL